MYLNNNRPDKDTYFLDIALKVSKRSTCIRRQYGAVIVKDGRIVGAGYNGSAKSVINCDEVGCIKDILDQPHGGSYEYCLAVHAEENALINSDVIDRRGATMYIAGTNEDGDLSEAMPCKYCKRKILNAEIEEVIILTAEGGHWILDPREWVEEDTERYLSDLEKAKQGKL